ncbi:hypothetical protein KR018_003420 [Drosophila ironensis]|nr:hypothetical protein KR018_003420 [Drosophila ironensis]
MWIDFLVLVTIIGMIRTQSLGSILAAIKLQVPYQTILLLNSNATFWNHEISQVNVPILNFNGNQSAYLKHEFNGNILALVYPNKDDNKIMTALYANLQNMRQTPTIIFTFSDQQIKELLLECLSHKMLNVLAFKDADFSTIYSYQAFPEFQIVQRKVRDIGRYFEPQLRDLKGYVLNILPDNIIPRTVAYRDSNGDRQLAGYLSHFIRSYAESINASLQIAWNLVPEDGMIPFPELIKLTETASIDFPLAIYGLELVTPINAVPMQLSKWFLMLPMQPTMPRVHYFIGFQGMLPMAILLAVVLTKAHRLEKDLSAKWLCFYIATKVLRGLLSHPFRLPRYLSPRLMFIYWLLLISGFILSNFYTANLATWLVHPPLGNALLNWEALRYHKVKVLVVPAELAYIREILGQEFDGLDDSFEVTNSVKFQAKRMSMDQSYAYPVTHSLWCTLMESQVRLRRPIFMESKEIVFIPFMILSMPLPNNSMYRKSLERYVSLTKQSGLLSLWFSRSFGELKRLGKLFYKADGDSEGFHEILWRDLYFIWLGYLGGSLLSLSIFLLEICFYKWQSRKPKANR